jgi:hypothetical protein
MPSDIEPSGDGETGLEDDGDDGMVCSVNAIVADAFVVPGDPDEPLLPNGGMRPAENLEDEEIREAREAGRSGEGIPGACVRGTEPVWFDGDGGGGGEVVGEGVRDLDGGIASRPFSAGACARRRDNDDGPAVGEEFARVRTGLNKWAGRLTRNESSTSAWGGSGGMDVSAGDITFGSFSADMGAFREDTRRLFDWLGCVQSSTSSM